MIATATAHLSFSQLRTYCECPRKWTYEKVLHVAPERVPASLAFGAAVHDAVEAVNLAAMAGERIDAGAAFSKSWSGFTAKDAVPLAVDDDEADGLEAKGRALAGIYRPPPGIVAVEQQIEVELDADLPPLVGRIDVIRQIDAGLVVTDVKTSSTKVLPDTEMLAAQLGLYAIAYPAVRCEAAVLFTGRGSPAIMARVLATRDYLARRAVRTPMWLMLRYGPRPIEASKLTVADWDAKRRTLSFPARITKNGHARSFVVDTETADLLTAAAGTREARQPLFLTSKQRAWTSHHLTDMVTVLIQRAKLPGTAYCCRHTACSRLIVLAKGDLPLVQSITGHRTLSELQRYLHATNERRHTIADAYDGGSVGLVENPSYLKVAP